MRAVFADGAGGPEVLVVRDVPDPEAGPGEVVLDVAAAGLNRADLLQRQGFYPPPPGASDVLGMECSGTVAAVGDGVEGWSIGDQACALLSAGAYATKVSVPAGQLLPVPAGVDLVEAAALPEVACTVWSNVFMVAALQADEVLLVHGGAGGIGTFAIQLAAQLGSRVFTTAGSEEKRDFCRSLGAEVAIDYREEDFVEVLKEHTDGAGADVILDNMGASYLGRNVTALATEGRLVVIGMQGGTKGELDLNALLRKRGAIVATTLRARPAEEKAAICRSVVEHVWPLVADGKVRPIVHGTVPLDDVRRAHELMESGSHTGKILLTTRSERTGVAGYRGVMSEQQGTEPERQVVVIGPDGQPLGSVPESALADAAAAAAAGEDPEERSITDLVEQPAKVMRIGSMIRQLLEEVKAAPLDEASRNRLKEIHQASIHELEAGLAPELVEELERLTLPFSEDQTPSEGELRIAQAQLVGWLEGLFHGIQTAIYAQQMSARAQFEQMRRGLPMGQGGQPQADDQGQQEQPHQPGDSGGMYL